MTIVDKLKEEHSGYAITLEVMSTLFMLTMFMVAILYMLRVMNVQRYMNTVLTTTAVHASRWGGTNTQAYKANVSETLLLITAQSQLNLVCDGYNAKIVGGPAKITYEGEEIMIQISYSLPSVFQTMSKTTALDGTQYDSYEALRNMVVSVKVKSIMSPSKLL